MRKDGKKPLEDNQAVRTSVSGVEIGIPTCHAHQLPVHKHVHVAVSIRRATSISGLFVPLAILCCATSALGSNSTATIIETERANFCEYFIPKLLILLLCKLQVCLLTASRAAAVLFPAAWVTQRTGPWSPTPTARLPGERSSPPRPEVSYGTATAAVTYYALVVFFDFTCC